MEGNPNGSVLYEDGMKGAPGLQGETVASWFCWGRFHVLPCSRLFCIFFSLQGIETFSHFDCFKKAIHITSGFCPVLSEREKEECAHTTPKRKGDVVPSCGRQGAGQRAGRSKLCPPVGVWKSISSCGSNQSSKAGVQGEVGIMEQFELQAGFCLSHSSQPWGGFVILWGQRSVPFLGSQIEFPDLVVR